MVFDRKWRADVRPEYADAWQGATSGTSPLEQLLLAHGFRSLYALEQEGGPSLGTLQRIVDGHLPRRGTILKIAKASGASKAAVSRAVVATARTARANL